MFTWTHVIALLAGLAAGWLLRHKRGAPSAHLIEEVYKRKLRLTEQEQDKALKELNANRVEMTTFGERFAVLDRRIAELTTELQRTKDAHGKAESELARRTAQIAGMEAEVARARAAEVEAARDRTEAIGARQEDILARTRAEDEAGARRAEASGLQRRLHELEESARLLTSALETRSGELDTSEGELARRRADLAEASGEVARLRTDLEDVVAKQGAEQRALSAQLEARSAELTRTHAELARLRRDLEGAQGERIQKDAELTRLASLRPERDAAQHELERQRNAAAALGAQLEAARARLAELEPLPARLLQLQEELAGRERQHETRERELERVGMERLASGLQAKDVELMEERRRSEERFERLHALELELERTRDRVRELQGASETQASSGDELREERRRLAAELAATKSAAAKAEATLGERAGRIAELEGALRGKDLQLRELARLARELEQAQARAQKLEQELARALARAQDQETAAKVREREQQELRRELARLEKDLRAAEGAREKGVSALQERVAKLRELEEALREKSAEVRQLESELRARPTASGTLRPVPRKSNGERDDLQRIAGIGPALEKKLNRLGFKTYRQLAALSKDELESLAERLGTSPERIRREGWIASARSALQSGGA